jgi:hypothetical protein
MYILKNKVPVPVSDVAVWGPWHKKIENRRVAKTILMGHNVSTVFLGIDHNYTREGLPILFETMIFECEDDNDFGPSIDYEARCSTWAEAEQQHQEAIEWLKRRIQ